MPIVTEHKRTPGEFAAFATEMAQLNPQGFRQPGKKVNSSSLPMKAAIAAGLTTAPTFTDIHSPRGNSKRQLRAQTRQHIKNGTAFIN